MALSIFSGVPPSGNGQLLRIGAAARLYAVSIETLRNLCNQGLIESVRSNSTKMGHRRILKSSADSFFYGEKQDKIIGNKRKKVLLYARVSTPSQSQIKNESSSLIRQKEELELWVKEHYPEAEIITYCDSSSSAKLNRPALSRLLKQVMNGEHNGAVLCCLHKDRLSRLALDLILMILSAFNIEVVFVNENEDKSLAELMADELINLIVLYSGRITGERGAKKRRKHLSEDTTREAVALINAGQTVTRTCEILNEKGHRTLCGSPIGYNTIRKVVFSNRDKLTQVIPLAENPTEKYKKLCLQETNESVALPFADLYVDYIRWCKSKKLTPETRSKFSGHFKKGEKCYCRIRGRQIHSYRGLLIKGKELHFAVSVKRDCPLTSTEIIAQFDFAARDFKGNQIALMRRYAAWCREKSYPAVTRGIVIKILKDLGWRQRTEGNRPLFYRG